MVELAHYLRETLGGRLRGVATYSETGWRLLYTRDDLRERADELDIEALITSFKDAELDTDTTSELFGDHGVTLRTYADMLILHIVDGERGNGTLISFDAEAGSDFTTFAAECASLAAALPADLAQRDAGFEGSGA